MKYIGWFIVAMLLIVFILNQLTIREYKRACEDYRLACEDYKKTIAIYEKLIPRKTTN